MKNMFKQMVGAVLAGMSLLAAMIAVGAVCRALMWAFNVGWSFGSQ